jgi:hypothetical protein
MGERTKVCVMDNWQARTRKFALLNVWTNLSQDAQNDLLYSRASVDRLNYNKIAVSAIISWNKLS